MRVWPMPSERRSAGPAALPAIPMNRRAFASALGLHAAALALALPCRSFGAAANLSASDAASGIRVALERGALSAVGLLGKNGGFLNNPKVRIPLPPAMDQAAKLLKALGQQQRVDELVQSMNRAAEQAVPEAKAMLVQTAKSITLDDAVHIVRGSCWRNSRSPRCRRRARCAPHRRA
jgi:Protein of unknown function (DUF4197)